MIFINDSCKSSQHIVRCLLNEIVYCLISKFDDDQDGKLTVDALPNVLRKGFGIAVTDREIFELLAKFNITEQTIRISFERFIRMLQYVVRQGDRANAPDYMRKLNHRCGPAVRHVNGHELKLLKKRTGGYLSSSMDEPNKYK
jgi:hypothetical protein